MQHSIQGFLTKKNQPLLHRITRISKVILLCSFVIACGGGSDEGVSSVSLYAKGFNGYIITSEKEYDPSGVLLSTRTYSIDKTNNVITKTYSDSGDTRVYYYNSSGQVEREVVIDADDQGAGGSYSNDSWVAYFSYNGLGLVEERTRDYSIDGDIDSSQTWTYSGDGYLESRSYDGDNDGFTDTEITYTWKNGQKLTRKIAEADGSSTTYSYSYTGDNTLPDTRTEDQGSDGSIERTLEYSVDTNNNRVLFSFFNEIGELTSYWVEEYESAGSEMVQNIDALFWNIYY